MRRRHMEEKVNMKNLLQTAKIYRSDALQDFILSLENKYCIESAADKYRSLVNFSANEAVPYHQWFKYREGFSGELISELIAMSGARAGECIIDPFCGSGTTNVVALLNGYNTLGLDINPMSAFIANAKVARYSADDVALVNQSLLNLKTYASYDYRESYEDIRKYFSEINFSELVRIQTFISSLPDTNAKNILRVAFDSIVMDCSDRKRDGNGLKKHPSTVTDVRSFFEAKVRLILKDIASVKPAVPAVGSGVCNTAYNLHEEYMRTFDQVSAGAIIFSPPYANSFDYFESYKLELVFGGYTNGMKGIHELRQKAVRSFIGAASQSTCDTYVDLVAKEIEDAIPLKEVETGRHDARTRKVPDMIRGYFADMREVIRQCSLTLNSGKKTYVVVDQSAYCGKIVPTDLLLAYLGEQEGFTVGRIIECRKARTSTQQLNKYPYLKTTLRESIVELVKQ